MVFLKTLLALTPLFFGPTSTAAADEDLCSFPDPCWPSDSVWADFNNTLGGKLVRARPAAAVCHDPFYDEAACAVAQSNWTNSFWRAQQPGGSQDTAWELGDSDCWIGTPRNQTCGQGLVPIYVAAVESVSDIQAALKFANDHKLKTRIKGASHDFVGRSTGNGTFGIQTIKLKGINFNDSFVPQGCQIKPQKAVTVAAGEHWFPVNQAADAHGVVVVSGSSYTVGAAGGWVLGGGHSSLSPQYGLGVDNVLEFQIVTLDGQLRTVNQCQDPDLFWALRGGGGGFGVVASVTHKTHPAITSITAMLLNVTYPPELYESFFSTYLALQPAMSDANFSGYSYPSPTGISAQLLVHNSNDMAAANATLKPLFDFAAANPGVTIDLPMGVLPSYLTIFNGTGQISEEGGSPAIVGSRLVPRSVFESPEQNAAITRMLASVQQAAVVMHLVAGGKVSQPAGDSTAAHPSWRQALQHIVIASAWEPTDPPAVHDVVRSAVTNQTQQLAALVPGFGAYMNEADHNEPNWQETFWGSNYPRLLEIKKQVDPQGILTCGKCVGDE